MILMILLCLINTSVYANDFYKGKELKIIIASIISPTMSFELNTRIMGKYIVRHIPGNPSVVFKNVPAAAGIAGTNMIANESVQDGTTIVFPIASVAIRGVMKDSPEIQYDSNTLNWIGAVTNGTDDPQLLYIRKDLELLPDFSNMLYGDTSSTKTMDPGPILKNILGYKPQIIYGYKTKQEIELAMQRKEVNSYTTALSLLKQSNYDIVNEFARPVIQYGSNKRNSLFPDVPTLHEFAKTQEQLDFVEFTQFTYYMTKSAAVGQNVPKDRVAILRKAFVDVCNDPEYLEEMKEKLLPVSCVEGSKVQEIVRSNTERYERIRHLIK